MKTFQQSFTIQQPPFLPFLEKGYLFFDIETTGFVAEKSFLYLIGCCYYKETQWNMIQWFCEDPKEEVTILQSFLSFLEGYHTMLHYNGTTFDLPYLKKKCKKYDIPLQFENYNSIDLYKIATTYKGILHFFGCKQKQIEQYFGIERTDRYTGGELIQVYANYLGLAKMEQLRNSRPLSNEPRSLASSYTNQEPDATTLLDCLLLHNADDLTGLVQISGIYAYHSLQTTRFECLNMEFDEKNRLHLHLQYDVEFPKSFLCEFNGLYVSGTKDCVDIAIPIVEGTLRHYLGNYKEYYYLPLEQTIIPKSFASSIDKAYREPAKASNCYLNKTSVFIPTFDRTNNSPIYQEEYKDKQTYLECTEDFLKDMKTLKKYVVSFMNYVIKNYI